MRIMCNDINMNTHSNSYHTFADEALCKRVAAGDRIAEETLVVRYQRLVRACARPYFLSGGDSEDLTQEGMLGLLTAIREYDPDRAASFSTYAVFCIRRRLLSAIKTAARKKHMPLNSAISFEAPLLDENGDRYPYSAPPAQDSSPEEVLIDREDSKERMALLKAHLSSFEAKILRLYLKGLSYSEIAAEVNKTTKSVDNAVQRIRRKVAQHLSSGVTSES